MQARLAFFSLSAEGETFCVALNVALGFHWVNVTLVCLRSSCVARVLVASLNFAGLSFPSVCACAILIVKRRRDWRSELTGRARAIVRCGVLCAFLCFDPLVYWPREAAT